MNKLNHIHDEECIKLIKDKFPDFLPYLESYLEDFGSDLGLSIQMIPFGEYTLDQAKSHNDSELKKIFDLVEFLLNQGDESVKDAMATCFLEYLMSKDPDEFKFSTFVRYLGEHSINYCRAWDEFTGVRTEGLWGNDKPATD